MSSRTIHERAISMWQTHLVVYGRPKTTRARLAAMRDCAARALAEADDRPEISARDWRAWVPGWDWSMPPMIGSGRAAHWHHDSYRRYACIARAIHEDLGWSGERVRRAARALTMDQGRTWTPPEEPIPTRDLLRIATLPAGHYDAGILSREIDAVRDGVDPELATRRTQWELWLWRVGLRAWGRLELARVTHRLDHDPSYAAPSMAAGLIRRLRGEDNRATDFRWCSGCEWLVSLGERPDLWDLFLARSAPPRRGRLGDVEAMQVHFGQACPDDFDRCLVLSLSYEIRVRAADLDRAQAALAKGQGFVLAGELAVSIEPPPGGES